MTAEAAAWPAIAVRTWRDEGGQHWRRFADGREEPYDPVTEADDQPAGDAPAPSTWVPVDLTAYLDGTHTPPLATLLRRSDGPGVAYPGRVHWLAGEPGALKSWLALHACAVVMHAGGSVVYIDLEDGPVGIVHRLTMLGISQEMIGDRLIYVSPDGPLSHPARDQLAGPVTGADLVVIDAATEALSAQGLSSKDDTDIASWLALLPRWAAKLGPAVLVLDHVIKDTEGRGRWATGSQHKLAGLDGCAYTLENVHPGGVGLTGRSRLFLSKDRHGQVEPHAVPSTGGKRWLADFVVDSSGPFTEAVLHSPAARNPDEPFVPTAVMTKVSAALVKADKPLSGREVEDRVPGKAQTIRLALAALVDEGHVAVEIGARNARLHRLLKPYPTPEDPT